MTKNEREQVLKMIADGKISAEEGLKLLNVLDQDSPEDIAPPASPRPSASQGNSEREFSRMDVDPRIERVKSTVQRLWQIPLWIGIGVLILSALGMAALGEAGKLNFWFFFLILPLLTGVGIIALSVGSRRARWIFVDVQQKPGEKPQRIFLGFPVPFKLVTWALRTFGGRINQTGKVSVDQIITMIETGFTGDEPLIVNVDEGEDGERVKVYIG
jgi:hypothetical protein